MKVYSRYINATIAVLRKDWSPEKFNDHLSFYSSDELPFCHGDEIAPDGNRIAFDITVAVGDSSADCSITRHDGCRSFSKFADDDVEALAQSSMSWISSEISCVVFDEDLRSDVAFLIYKNGSQEITSDGDWEHTCDAQWLGKVGDGDEIGPVDSSFAGGVLLEVVSGEDVAAVIEDEVIWPKSQNGDDINLSDFVEESSRFIGIGKE